MNCPRGGLSHEMELSARERIINLVENLCEYQHIFSVDDPNSMMKSLMDKGYYLEKGYHTLYVSKTLSFKDKIHYHSLAMSEKFQDSFIRIKITDQAIVGVDNFILHASWGNNEFLAREFIGYDENSSTLPEIWLKLFLSIYGKPMPIKVRYSRTIVIETEREYTPAEMQVNKLL